MQDAAVVRALVTAEAGLFFQQRDRGRRQGPPELVSRAEPDQSTADDDHSHWAARRRTGRAFFNNRQRTTPT